MPSMPLAPRLQSTRGGSSRDRPEALDVAHGHRGGHEQRRLARQQRCRARRPPPAHTGRARRAPPPAPRRELVGAAPVLQPLPLRRPWRCRRGRPPDPRPAARARAAGSSASERLTTELGSCQAPSGSSATCVVEAEPRQPAAQRLGDRQVADAQHQVGLVGRGEARVAQQHVVVGDGGLAATGARQRVGQQRPAGGLRRSLAAAGASPLVALVATGDQHAPAGFGRPARAAPARRRARTRAAPCGARGGARRRGRCGRRGAPRRRPAARAAGS